MRDTLVHLMRTQHGWLSWWDGSLSADDAYNLRLDPADYPDVAALRSLWASLLSQTEAFLARLSEAGMGRVYEQPIPGRPDAQFILWKMMFHVLNRGTQHRSEVAAMLTDVGASPGDLDYIRYVFTTP